MLDCAQWSTISVPRFAEIRMKNWGEEKETGVVSENYPRPLFFPNDNWPMLEVYRSKVRRMAKRHLSRRSQNSYVNWVDFTRFTDLHPLASPKRLVDLIAMDRELRSSRGR